MAETYFVPTDLEMGPVAILSIRSITGRQFDHVAHVLANETHEWSIDRQVDYDGYVLFMISQEGCAATYIISGRSNRIEVAKLQDDELQTLGSFSDIDSAVHALLQSP